ncbi:hypothetical protein Hypma_003574 [Hypsizygus marmoreus]|uniref:Fungal-type protein kinase domain-containing protein n=1 Tax=Hypsizygus marmoreus TaxID=39966 RepID=A0A369J1V5_HYPMA|nr:hypothetical protein Hypma_003574 [Hypsizygus marmoreus]
MATQHAARGGPMAEIQSPTIKIIDRYQASSYRIPNMICNTLILDQRYQNLSELTSVDEFQDVFVDYLECHHHLYTNAGFLLDRLGQANLMFTRRRDGPIQGVLNDWDLNLPACSEQDYPSSRRSWMFPFMPRALLRRSGGPHLRLYTHGLECFFYILVWVAVTLDFSGKKRKHNNILASWIHPQAAHAFDAKCTFMVEEVARDWVFRCIPREAHGLRDEWLIPLWNVFCTAKAVSMMYRHARRASSKDDATDDGYVTFHVFMSAIRRQPRRAKLLDIPT